LVWEKAIQVNGTKHQSNQNYWESFQDLSSQQRKLYFLSGQVIPVTVFIFMLKEEIVAERKPLKETLAKCSLNLPLQILTIFFNFFNVAVLRHLFCENKNLLICQQLNRAYILPNSFPFHQDTSP